MPFISIVLIYGFLELVMSHVTSTSPDREVALVMQEVSDSSPEQQQRQQRRTRTRKTARKFNRAPVSSDTSTNDEAEVMQTRVLTNYTRGNTSAGLAVVRPPTVFELAGQCEIASLQELFEKSESPLDVNITDAKGLTMLMYAAHFGQYKAVEFLIERNADVTIANEKGADALLLAATEGHRDVIEVLLKHSQVDVNREDKFGNTAIMLASYHNHPQCVELLLQHFADPLQRNHADTSAYELATTRHHTAVQQTIEAHLLLLLHNHHEASEVDSGVTKS